jgi:phosphoadenosine phosphosulfate reductase
MEFAEIQTRIEAYKKRGLSLFTTSSFQTHSLVLLHIISRIDNSVPVYFIQTGFHFPETLSFRDRIAALFGLNVVDVASHVPKSQQRDSRGRLLFASDPDHCCYLNKTQPLEPILAQHDVWINGVRADQSVVRKNFKVEERAPFHTIRFHPMLDWTAKKIYEYRKKFSIPSHPLEEKGYFSIGCEPCTRIPSSPIEEREGRWFGLRKNECGLNIDLVSK